MKTKILLLTIACFISGALNSQIIHVPADYNSIQEGINAASDGDTVLVAENTYYENIRFMGKAITLASEFILDGNSSHIDNTIINGSQAADPDSAAAVMFVNGEDTTSIINGFTITGGGGLADNDSLVKFGGGISVHNAGAMIVNNHITNNMVTHAFYRCGGAGIGSFLNSENKWIVIEDNIISNNQSFANAATSFGGGIYVMNSARIRNNTIEQNSCYNIGDLCYGGGVYLLQCGKSFLTGNIINENTLNVETYSIGGGVCIMNIVDTLFFNSNIISENFNGGSGFGGGIGIRNEVFDVVYYIDRNILSNNYSTRNGGGLWIYNIYKIGITNNSFENNEASGKGGAICFHQYLGKNKNTFSPDGLMEKGSKNTAQSREDIFHPVIANNNFISNTATLGGAIDSDHGLETPIIFNSIFWKNTAPAGHDLYNSSSIEMLVYNNDIDTSMIYTPWAGADNIFCNPNFMSDSMHLDWPSLCVNAGIESFTYDGETYYCPEYDIDGDVRPFDGTMPDIGADEAQWYYVNVDESISIVNSILQIYPNPFTTSTTLSYELAKSSTIQLTIYDYLGKQVEVIEKKQAQGKQQITWNAEGLPAGVYFCVVKCSHGNQTIKMVKL